MAREPVEDVSSSKAADLTGSREDGDAATGTVAIVVLTYNRPHLLRQCVEKVLARTSERTKEIVIWDNASTDETGPYLDSLTDPRIRVIHHPENIGQSAYARAFRLTSSDYLIDLDDDVIDAPDGWDKSLMEAFERLPDVGFLQARLADDGHSPGARLFYREKAHLYTLTEINGVRVWVGGPVGGGCTITSRELHDTVGGFRENKKQVFWFEDQAYIEDIKKLGFRAVILDEVEVFHAGGSYYSQPVPSKIEYYAQRQKRRARKDAVKRMLLRIPLVEPLNERYSWFQPPPPRS